MGIASIRWRREEKMMPGTQIKITQGDSPDITDTIEIPDGVCNLSMLIGIRGNNGKIVHCDDKDVTINIDTEHHLKLCSALRALKPSVSAPHSQGTAASAQQGHAPIPPLSYLTPGSGGCVYSKSNVSLILPPDYEDTRNIGAAGENASYTYTSSDLHGDPIRLIWFLMAIGVIDISDSNYDRLVTDYEQLCVIRNKINSQTTDFDNSSTSNNKDAEEFINQFNTFLSNCNINIKEPPKFRLLGDFLADRQGNDKVMLHILKSIPPKEVIIGNHDLITLYLSQATSHEDAEIKWEDIKRSALFPAHMNSLKRADPINGIHDIKRGITSLQGKMKLFSYTYHPGPDAATPGKLTINSHTPISILSLYEFAQDYLKDDLLPTQEEYQANHENIIKVIDKINTRFQLDIRRGNLPSPRDLSHSLNNYLFGGRRSRLNVQGGTFATNERRLKKRLQDEGHLCDYRKLGDKTDIEIRCGHTGEGRTPQKQQEMDDEVEEFNLSLMDSDLCKKECTRVIGTLVTVRSDCEEVDVEQVKSIVGKIIDDMVESMSDVGLNLVVRSVIEEDTQEVGGSSVGRVTCEDVIKRLKTSCAFLLGDVVASDALEIDLLVQKTQQKLVQNFSHERAQKEKVVEDAISKLGWPAPVNLATKCKVIQYLGNINYEHVELIVGNIIDNMVYSMSTTDALKTVVQSVIEEDTQDVRGSSVGRPTCEQVIERLNTSCLFSLGDVAASDISEIDRLVKKTQQNLLQKAKPVLAELAISELRLQDRLQDINPATWRKVIQSLGNK